MSRPLDPRLVRAVPSLRPFLVTLGLLQLLGSAAVVAQAALLAKVLTDIVLGERHGSLLQSLVLLASAGLVRAALAALQEWAAHRASARIRAELRDRVVRAVATRGPTWAAQRSAGELATAAGPGLESLDGFVTRALPALVSACIIPPVALAGIGFVDWRSATILVCVLPLVPIFMALVGLSTGRQMEARYSALARLAGHFLDLVQGLTTLKVYGQATRQVATVREATHAYRRQTMQTLRVAFLSGLVLDLIATLSVAVVAVSVGLRLDSGHVSLRVALTALLLAPEVFAPLRAVGAQHHAAEEGRVAAAAALDLLQESPAAELTTGPVPLYSNGSLSLQGLSVRYDGRVDDALADLHLDLRPGELVAVQGVSGGGKSTLLAVLLGFVAPFRGSVQSGSTEPPLDSAQWRAGVAWLPQHPRPTQADVGAEVALGAPGASPAAVLAAIADCHAPHPTTPLGEDGAAVSAGQRRRVALARALLRARSVRAGGGVPLVLLDEPSEDLDQETERVVASVVASMAGWATVLMVTHSGALAAGAGRRIVLDNGRLVSDLRRVPVMPAPVEARSPAPYPPVEHLASNGQPSWRPLLSGLPGARRRLAGAALLSGATGLAGLTLTATSIWLICRAAQHPNLQALALAVVGVRTFALTKALLRYAERIVSHDVALRLLAELRARVFAALEPLAPAGLAEFGRGDLLRRFVSDVDGVQEGLVRAVVPLAGAVLTASAAVVVVALLAPAAAAALAAGLLVALVIAPVLALRTAGDAGALTVAAALRDQRTNALLDGLSELTAYGATAGAIADIAAAEAEVTARSRRPAAGAALGAAVSGAAAAVTLAAVLWLAATAAKHSMAPISAGVLAAAVLAGFDALAGLPTAFAALSRLRRGLDRIAALLSTPPLQLDPTVPACPPAGALSLRLTDVAVAPARAAAVVVRSATLQVIPGSRIALMGPSGCGKTTLLKAALRLLPVGEGEVCLDGDGQRVSVAALSAAQIPPLVAGSLQGDHVFDASLRDNLRVVAPDATDDELDLVAERAGLRGFVRSLPEGWSTAAGADGSSLSGGQRQRLLLARALLADPAVLVLDEPTAHLDEQTAREVLADLLAGTRGSTVLLSTHRQPDQGVLDVLTFEDGRLHPLPTECPSSGPSPLPTNDEDAETHHMDTPGKAPEALTRAQCLSLLQQGGIGRLAYSQRALPAIVTVGYAVVDDVLVLRLDEDSPELASLRNSVVAFQTDHGSQLDERSWSVSCVSKARPVEDAAEALDLALGNDWSLSTSGRPVFLLMDSDLLEGRVFHALPLARAPSVSSEAAPAS